MCSSCDSRDVSDMVTSILNSVASLGEVFIALSKHRLWDYINYYLLQSIIEHFVSDDKKLNGMMKQYQKDLSGHTLALGIEKCLYLDATNSVQINPAFPPPTNVTCHSFSYVKDLWRSLQNQFSLPNLERMLQLKCHKSSGTRNPRHICRRAFYVRRAMNLMEAKASLPRDQAPSIPVE